VAVCDKIKRKSTRVCRGSLNKRIKIFTRSITPPSGSSVDFLEDFVEDREVWGMIDTVTGITEFDDTNIEIVVTHDVYIDYIEDITFEKWLIAKIDKKDTRLRIIRVLNYQENNLLYQLRCTIRGIDTLPVNEV